MSELVAVGRRGALGLMAGAAAAIGATTAASARKALDVSTPLDLATDAGRRTAYLMMRGALDEQLVIGCISGQYYGVVDDALTPLFGVVSATFSRYRALPSGGTAAFSAERAYFTDPHTGEAMDSFLNPYTGETVAIPSGGYAPAKTVITPDLQLKLANDIPGVVFDHNVGPVEASGDDVWITEITRTSRAIPGQPKPFHYSEIVTMHARRAELVRGAARVACETSFVNVVAWRPWLKMANRSGHMMSFGSGRYGATLATLPPAWIKATQARSPELLADPAAVLAPLWNAA